MKKLLALAVMAMLVVGCSKMGIRSDSSTADKGVTGGEGTSGIQTGKVTDEDLTEARMRPTTDRYPDSGITFDDIYFHYDKYDIQDSEKAALDKVSDYLIENSGAKLMVEGHCDDRGTNEYNLALGDRRAKSVQDYLKSTGVSSRRIETISYGEEKPACFDETEGCWTRNRRAHFAVVEELR